MHESDPVSPLLEAVAALCEWLDSEHVPGVVIGGVAASLLGRPRLTQDVDALVLLQEDSWGSFLQSGTRFGLVPRIPDPIQFAHRARVLLLKHEPSGIDIDVAFGLLPFEEKVIAEAVQVEVQGRKIPVPRPEDLIIMKAVANRPRDLVDIESILDACPDVDVERVRQFVKEFSEVLETPGILIDLDRILEKRLT